MTRRTLTLEQSQLRTEKLKRFLMWAAFVWLLTTSTGTAVIGLLELDSIKNAASNEAVVSHRVRNEVSHKALCDLALAIGRAASIQLVDEEGDPIECPPSLSEEELGRRKGN